MLTFYFKFVILCSMKNFSLELNGISKKYGRVKALSNVDLSIEKNSITGVIGPNGAGKSTLLRIISGFERQDSGDVFIFGRKVFSFSERKNYISFMPEETVLYKDLYVAEVLNFFHEHFGKANVEYLNFFSLKEIEDKKVGHLSKGWHQRLKIYISLLQDKPLKILDEPLDGLDPLQVNEFFEVIKNEKGKGSTFILSIHQLFYAEKVCDHFVLLESGRLVLKGTIESMREEIDCPNCSLEKLFVKALR